MKDIATLLKQFKFTEKSGTVVGGSYIAIDTWGNVTVSVIIEKS